MIKLIAAFLLLVSIYSAQAQNTQKVKPFVLGEIKEIKSELLKEIRSLNIYLPEGYNANDTTHYAVAYVLDGSSDEDFIHVAGLYQFNSFEWINRTPKTIVVGIATVDRRRDFTSPTLLEDEKKRFPTAGQSDKFISFIEKELQPYIQKNYKTTKSATLIGQSFGGLLATEILFKNPNLFTQYIIISPSLWWNNGTLLGAETERLKLHTTTATKIYIAVGKEGLAPSSTPRVMEVDANLLVEKIQLLKNPALQVYFDYLPEEDHATISHLAIYNALKHFALTAK